MDNDDKVYLGDPKVGSKEFEAIMGGGGRTLTIGEVQELARQACERHSEFTATIKQHMTRDRARRIKELRVKENESWRVIAATTYLEWGANGYWFPIFNQIAGIALCEVAADVLGEKRWE